MGLRPEVFGVSLEHVWHNVIGSMSQADALAFYEKYVKKMFTDEKEQNEARTFVLSLLKDGAEAVASVGTGTFPPSTFMSKTSRIHFFMYFRTWFML